MTAAKVLAPLIGAISLLVAPALAHRMPEVEVTIERTEIDDRPLSAFTVRFHAEDVLKLMGLERDLSADLQDPELHDRLAAKAAAAMTVEEGSLAFLGGMVEGNSVFLFYTSAPSAKITDARVLSSVHESWTNRINDRRAEGIETQVFTQGGELHGHRH